MQIHVVFIRTQQAKLTWYIVVVSSDSLAQINKKNKKHAPSCLDSAANVCGWSVLMSSRALGIQEYVEAVSFLHYIRHRSLISLEEINAKLVFMKEEKVSPQVNPKKTL